MTSLVGTSSSITEQVEAKQMLIDGAWVSAADGGTLDVHDPATGELIATIPAGAQQDADRAVSGARRAFDKGAWANISARDRQRLLLRFSEVVSRDRERLAQIEVSDNGKSLASALEDVDEAAFLFEYYSGWPTKLAGEALPVGTHGLTLIRSTPMGVAALITPWNFPILMAAQKLAPALAAGCACILKPAEQTSLTALELGRIAQEVGIPDGIVNVLTGTGGSVGAPLVNDPRVQKVSFTGSLEVGKQIGRQAGEGLKRVTLELGGKSASVVFADAKLDDAIVGVCVAAFANQGQVCGACSRVFAEDAIYDELLDGIATYVRGLVPGRGTDPAATAGPLISETQRRRVHRYLDVGEHQDGGTIAVEGALPADPSLVGGYFVKPTVFVDVPDTATIAQEEIFGPVMAVMRFSDAEDVVSRVNAVPYGLAGSVWTQDLDRAFNVAEAIDSGTVWVNDALKAPTEGMWGGVKGSGVGRELGKLGLEEFLEKRQMWIRRRH